MSEPSQRESWVFEPSSVTELNAVLDRYEFLDLIGQGGMGAVYRALQPELQRTVAIKVLPRFDRDDEAQMRFTERFQREAQAMARFSHPNLVTVYDFGQTTDGQLFFVMEYIEGTDLERLIATGELTLEHVFGWIPQVCDGLQYAHNRGVVHRDIKPSNVLIDQEGQVKIADFGLARFHEAGGGELHRLTQSDVAVGTPDYVAPEVLDSDGEVAAKVDHRADLYALGVILYLMLTGKIPRGAWRPPSALVGGLGGRFDELVMRALDPNPDGRFQQASEIRAGLEQIRRASDGESAEVGVPSVADGPEGSAVEAASAAASRPEAREMPAAEAPRRRKAAPNVPRTKAPVVLGIGLVLLVAVTLAIWIGISRNGEREDGEGALHVEREAGESRPPVGSRSDLLPAADAGGWADLLSDTDLVAQSIDGDWRLEESGRALLSPAGEHRLFALLAEDPGASYDVRFRFTRTRGDHSIALLFASASGFGAVEVDAWMQDLDGFQEIDGRDLREQHGPAPGNGFSASLENGRSYEWLLEVRPGEARFFIDGERLHHVDLEEHRLTLTTPWLWSGSGDGSDGRAYHDDQPVYLVLATWQSEVRFESVHWRRR